MKCTLLLFLFGFVLQAQDALEIVRQSVERDQSNWAHMRDYTWTISQSTRQLNAKGAVKTENTEQWETVVLDGEPHQRRLAKNGKPLSAVEQSKQQQKLDAALAKLQRETPEERKRRLDKREKERQKDREFFREIPSLYRFELQGESKVDGREVWIVDAKPKPDYKPKDSQAKVLQKIQGKLWIDKTEYQWVRLEFETTDTMSYGLLIARLAPGVKVVFEQTRINNELWVPKHAFVSGSARLGLLKKLSLQQDTTWSNYKKFQVESKMVDTAAP